MLKNPIEALDEGIPLFKLNTMEWIALLQVFGYRGYIAGDRGDASLLSNLMKATTTNHQRFRYGLVFANREESADGWWITYAYWRYGYKTRTGISKFVRPRPEAVGFEIDDLDDTNYEVINELKNWCIQSGIEKDFETAFNMSSSGTKSNQEIFDAFMSFPVDDKYHNEAEDFIQNHLVPYLDSDNAKRNPIRRGKDSNGSYFQWGKQKKYYFDENEESREKAYEKARKQAGAIFASGYQPKSNPVDRHSFVIVRLDIQARSDKAVHKEVEKFLTLDEAQEAYDKNYSTKPLHYVGKRYSSDPESEQYRQYYIFPRRNPRKNVYQALKVMADLGLDKYVNMPRDKAIEAIEKKFKDDPSKKAKAIKALTKMNKQIGKGQDKGWDALRAMPVHNARKRHIEHISLVHQRLVSKIEQFEYYMRLKKLKHKVKVEIPGRKKLGQGERWIRLRFGVDRDALYEKNWPGMKKRDIPKRYRENKEADWNKILEGVLNKINMPKVMVFESWDRARLKIDKDTWNLISKRSDWNTNTGWAYATQCPISTEIRGYYSRSYDIHWKKIGDGKPPNKTDGKEMLNKQLVEIGFHPAQFDITLKKRPREDESDIDVWSSPQYEKEHLQILEDIIGYVNRFGFFGERQKKMLDVVRNTSLRPRHNADFEIPSFGKIDTPQFDFGYDSCYICEDPKGGPDCEKCGKPTCYECNKGRPYTVCKICLLKKQIKKLKKEYLKYPLPWRESAWLEKVGELASYHGCTHKNYKCSCGTRRNPRKNYCAAMRRPKKTPEQIQKEIDFNKWGKMKKASGTVAICTMCGSLAEVRCDNCTFGLCFDCMNNQAHKCPVCNEEIDYNKLQSLQMRKNPADVDSQFLNFQEIKDGKITGFNDKITFIEDESGKELEFDIDDIEAVSTSPIDDMEKDASCKLIYKPMISQNGEFHGNYLKTFSWWYE